MILFRSTGRGKASAGFFVAWAVLCQFGAGISLAAAIVSWVELDGWQRALSLAFVPLIIGYIFLSMICIAEARDIRRAAARNRAEVTP